MLHEAKRRAKKMGIEYDLTFETVMIMIPEYCPVLHFKLNWDTVKGGNPNKPSIDRIDSSKGYTLDNIVIVSWRANDLKADGTPEELMKLAVFYSRYSIDTNIIEDK